MSLTEDRIREQAAESLSVFRQRALPMAWCPRSILLSEAFAFCAMCDLHRVDMIVESGVCNGRSTEIWAKYSGSHIIAIDREITAQAIERLEPLGVQMYGGNASEVLVPLVKQHPQARLGIFIDGPKDDEALALAEKCLEHDQVAFVGVHDMARLVHGTPHAARAKCEALPYKKWFTDAEWFVELAADLDADESHWDEEQGTRWTPGYRSERHSEPVPLGSYGYTIGFLVNE